MRLSQPIICRYSMGGGGEKGWIRITHYSPPSPETVINMVDENPGFAEDR